MKYKSASRGGRGDTVLPAGRGSGPKFVDCLRGIGQSVYGNLGQSEGRRARTPRRLFELRRPGQRARKIPNFRKLLWFRKGANEGSRASVARLWKQSLSARFSFPPTYPRGLFIARLWRVGETGRGGPGSTANLNSAYGPELYDNLANSYFSPGRLEPPKKTGEQAIARRVGRRALPSGLMYFIAFLQRERGRDAVSN